MIEKMRELRIEKGIKYILDEHGGLSVDAPNSMSDKEATDISNRVGVIDRIINTKFDEYKELEIKDLRSDRSISNIYNSVRDTHKESYINLFEK